MLLQEEREQVADYGRKMSQSGLVTGTFGNISIFNSKENLAAISPSGMDYADIKPEDVVIITPEGKIADGKRKPSSEVDLHRIFYMRRPEIHAVVHTHSTYATVLACMQKTIPPIHYVIAYGGQDIPCTPYVQYGTWELAEEVYKTMGERYACLMGNHGMVAVGENIAYTYDTAEQIEYVAKLYCISLSMGGGVKNLTKEELEVAIRGFKTYRTKV